MPSHIGKATQPQNAPNFPFLKTIANLQLGHFGALTETFECLEQTGTPVLFNFVAMPPHSAHFI